MAVFSQDLLLLLGLRFHPFFFLAHGLLLIFQFLLLHLRHLVLVILNLSFLFGGSLLLLPLPHDHVLHTFLHLLLHFGLQFLIFSSLLNQLLLLLPLHFAVRSVFIFKFALLLGQLLLLLDLGLVLALGFLKLLFEF